MIIVEINSVQCITTINEDDILNDNKERPLYNFVNIIRYLYKVRQQNILSKIIILYNSQYLLNIIYMQYDAFLIELYINIVTTVVDIQP